MSMTRQFFYRQNIHALFQQVGGVTMAQRMGMNIFMDAGALYYLAYYPLGTTLRHPFAIITFKEIFPWMFCRKIPGYPPAQHYAQRYAPVFGTFALLHMHHPSFKVNVTDFDASDFTAPESAIVTKTDDEFMLEQFTGMEQ